MAATVELELRARLEGVKAVFSGVANGVVTADHLDEPATYEDLAAIGNGLGSAGFIVYDDTADMVALARMFARFLHVESCGQCGACKLHSGTVSDTLMRAAGLDIRRRTTRRMIAPAVHSLAP
jgi:NADH:ubiquinone oxidoreductase subunit F (NADH-binding)